MTSWEKRQSMPRGPKSRLSVSCFFFLGGIILYWSVSFVHFVGVIITIVIII